MAQSIIYPQEDGSIALVIPAPECGLSIEEIARKDVPAGVPYLLMNNEDLPQDHEFFSAWEADFSNPDGVGIGPDAWFAEQAAKEQE
jgi:hypothetical protein